MITKAVVPVAGRGSRLAPLTSVMPKALLPLVDAAGRCRPVVHWICAEAAGAGVSELALVVSPDQRRLLERYLQAADGVEPKLPARIDLIEQEQPFGFGDAVARAARFVGNDNFLLMLGDHVYRESRGASPCAAQVITAFARTGGAAMIGVQEVPEAELAKVGVVKGLRTKGEVYRCEDFVEKPDLLTAMARLETPGLQRGRYLAHGGLYAFSPKIFDCLSELSRGKTRAAEEVTLADAQSILLAGRPNDYYLCRFAGRAYDVGTPEGLAATGKMWNSPA